MTKRKVVVTGSSGFVGTQLLKSLKTKNFEIYSLDIIDNTNPLEGISYVKKDLKTVSVDFLSDFFLDAIIIHLAALSTSSICENEPELAIDVNIKVTRKIIEAANIAKSPVIFASSEWVYQESLQSKEIDENHVLQLTKNTNLYAMTKIVGEWICMRYSNDYLILRFGIIYGEREQPQSAIESIIQGAVISGKVEIGNAQTARRFIHVDDICSGIIQCIENYPKSLERIFNLVGDSLVSLEKVVYETEKLIGTSIALKIGENLASIRNPSPRLFESVFSWNPEISLKVGLRRLIDWELRRKGS